MNSAKCWVLINLRNLRNSIHSAKTCIFYCLRYCDGCNTSLVHYTTKPEDLSIEYFNSQIYLRRFASIYLDIYLKF